MPMNVQCYEKVAGHGNVSLERIVYRGSKRPEWRIVGFWNHAMHFARKKDALWAYGKVKKNTKHVYNLREETKCLITD